MDIGECAVAAIENLTNQKKEYRIMLNEKNKKGIFAREGGRLTHGSLFSGI